VAILINLNAKKQGGVRSFSVSEMGAQAASAACLYNSPTQEGRWWAWALVPI
jgi:hypothetical protein